MVCGRPTDKASQVRTMNFHYDIEQNNVNSKRVVQQVYKWMKFKLIQPHAEANSNDYMYMYKQANS